MEYYETEREKWASKSLSDEQIKASMSIIYMDN